MQKQNKRKERKQQSICAAPRWKIILRIIFKGKKIFFINISNNSTIIAWEFQEFIYGAFATLIQQAAVPLSDYMAAFLGALSALYA